MQILFVCTGNTCRSPMAEWLFNSKVKRLGLTDNITAKSAGIFAAEGAPASEQAVQIIHEQGGDLTQHRSQTVTPGLIEEVDLILTMTYEQKQHLLTSYPDIIVNGKDETAESLLIDDNGNTTVMQLSEYAEKLNENTLTKTDIRDPIGGTTEEYYQVFSELDQLITLIVDYLAKTLY